MIEAVKAVLKAYVTAELIRRSGFLYSVLSMSLWILLFIAPISLFTPPNTDKGLIAGYAFLAVLVFSSYSTATWDWAWEIRWLIRNGILEYVVASGRNILVLYAGVAPISLTWLVLALGGTYLVLAAIMAPPAFLVTDPLILLAGLALLAIVLFAHSLILGGTVISVGTSGPVMELTSWILPIATGGLVPLVKLPIVAAEIALMTPYAYPAELIRNSLLGTPTLLPVNQTLIIGTAYGLAYLLLSIAYFQNQYHKMLKEGVRSIGMY